MAISQLPPGFNVKVFERLPKMLGLFFGVMGLASAAGGALAWRSTATFRASAARADGLVVDMVRSRRSGGRPVVRWQDPAGIAHEFAGNVSTSPPSYATGDHVTVIYAPDNPNRARLDTFTENWLMATIFGGLGVLIAAMGFGIAAFLRPSIGRSGPAPPPFQPHLPD